MPLDEPDTSLSDCTRCMFGVELGWPPVEPDFTLYMLPRMVATPGTATLLPST